MEHELYISRCLQLAALGGVNVAPNPMVGVVLVADGKIVGEGYHRAYGQSHAEVNAINSVEDSDLLSKATLYVNLEPCAHYGKTPPCAELIVRKKIPKVVIGNIDPNPKVAGKGVKILQNAGIEVITNVLENECRELNKRFFTFIEKKRPFVFLKWAQTADGFLDKNRENCSEPPLTVSNELTKLLTHKIRTENHAILVGTNTVLLDNPKLSARRWAGKNPIRLVIDEKGKIPKDFNVFDSSQQTIIFKEKNINNLLKLIYGHNIHSVLVEGGEKLLNSFIQSNLWDCAQVEIAHFSIGSGVIAPNIAKLPVKETNCEGNRILEFDNR